MDSMDIDNEDDYNDTRPKIDVPLVDEATCIAIAQWITNVVEPYMSDQSASSTSSSSSSTITNTNLELEILFGKLEYRIPQVAFSMPLPTLANQLPKSAVRKLLMAVDPPLHVIPMEWQPTSKMTGISCDMLIHLNRLFDQPLANLNDDADLQDPPLMATTSWTVHHMLNFDPIVDKNVSTAESFGRARFEKIRVTHVASEPETIWAHSRIAHIFTHHKASNVQEMQNVCKLTKIVSPTITPSVSASVIQACSKALSALPNGGGIVAPVQMADANPWMSQHYIATRKRKLAVPSILATNFLCLADLALYANLEERIILKPNASSPTPIAQFAELTKFNPNPHASISCLPVVIQNPSTHRAPNPVIACRKSFYYGMTDLINTPTWRLDLSIFWRPEGSSSCPTPSLTDYLYVAHLAQEALTTGNTSRLNSLLCDDPLPGLSFELELECINLIGLLIHTRGKYVEFAQKMIGMASYIQSIMTLATTSSPTFSSTSSDDQVGQHLNNIQYTSLMPESVYHLLS